MSKLFNLKKWLTIPETAKHLSIIFGEDVTEADIFRFALDGHLKLSVNLVNHTQAKVGKVVEWKDTRWTVFPKFASIRDDNGSTLDKYKNFENIPTDAVLKINEIPINKRKIYEIFLTSKAIGDYKFLNLEKNVQSIDGVWDLAMIGAERLDIEHKYQMLTNGPAITLQSLDGPFLEKDQFTMCQLQESFDDNEYTAGSKAQLKILKMLIEEDEIPEVDAKILIETHSKNRKKYLEKRKENPNDDFYPSGGLPKDAVLIVRTDELRRFEHSVSAQNTELEKPLETTERNTLLSVIGAMCKYEGIDPKDRTTTSQIVQMTEDLGAPVSDDTVRAILKKTKRH